VGLISLEGFRSILKVRRLEFYWALAATAGVVLLGTLKGILVAILISLASLAQQVANPAVYEVRRKRGTNVFRRVDEGHPDDEAFEGLLMVRVEGRVFFANAARIGERLRLLAADHGASVIAVHMGGVFDLEYTALKALIEGEERLRAEGKTIWLVSLTPGVLDVVQRSGWRSASAPSGCTSTWSRRWQRTWTVGQYDRLTAPPTMKAGISQRCRPSCCFGQTVRRSDGPTVQYRSLMTL
jgi:MFS superfamily sulfate permease-like transporter